MKKNVIVLFATASLFFLMTSCRGQTLDRHTTFEMVWNKVNGTFFDTTFGGLNWNNAHDRYLPQTTAAGTDDEFYRLVNTMLWELNVSHANLIPPGLLARREPLVCAEGSPGIDIRMINGLAVVTSVRPGSPAENQGLRRGYVIDVLDGIPVERIVHEAEKVMRPPKNSHHRVALVTKEILGRIYGVPGTEISIAYSDEGGIKHETRMARVKRTGRAVGPSGLLYLAVDLEARRLDNGIGYIRLNTFQPPLVAQVSNAIRSLGTITGIIFDLRGNAGGEIEGMPELFLKERALLYLSRSRKGMTQVVSEPAAVAFNGPLVLLVDQLSGSAGELFACCLQAIGRAVVVGERTPGAVMESDMTVLPNGAILMVPVAQLSTPDGTVLEGHGVVPSVEIGLDREQLLKGIDSQLEAARSYLEKEALK